MKKNLIYIGLLVAGLTTASCDKYLDIQPVGTVIPKTEADFRALLVSAYQVFPAHKSMLSLRTDELLLDEYSVDLPSIKDLYLWNDQNPDITTLPMAWETVYKTIFYANHIIAEAEQKAGNSNEVQQIRAEAYLLRAYSHFELLNTYADNYNGATAATDKGIPISIKIDLEQLFEPATIEAVYQQIFADMDAAYKLLQVEDSDVKVKYRFSKRAYYAFESRMRLYRGEWALSKAAADKALAINNELENLTVAGFKTPNDFQSKEMIQAWERVGSSSVSRSTFISSELLNKYADGDFRKAIYFQKSSGDYVSAKGGDNKFNVSFRNAELYLIKAEVEARLNNKDAAISNLEALLKNRLTADALAVSLARYKGLTSEKLIDEIVEERARELALEGLRWYDLKRTTRPEIIHYFQWEPYMLNHNDPRYIIRYPREAISNNPNL